jgi:hypothetical protein
MRSSPPSPPRRPRPPGSPDRRRHPRHLPAALLQRELLRRRGPVVRGQDVQRGRIAAERVRAATHRPDEQPRVHGGVRVAAPVRRRRGTSGPRGDALRHGPVHAGPRRRRLQPLPLQRLTEHSVLLRPDALILLLHPA